MIPLIPTLALAFVSFISSVFVILRIVIPILPPSPLSRRVPPSEFGLPNFRTLTPADKSHLWLAGFDILALAVFLWQAITESLGGPSDYAEAQDAGSAVRLWLAMSIRQTCLLVVACITLLHVRLGRSVSLGTKHWIVWAPTLLLAITSTIVAGVLAGVGIPTFFVGLVGYSTAVAVISSGAFIWLIATLVIIKNNLAALNEPSDNWPPVREVEEKPRPSFATEDIDALRDGGSSWITSNASSRHDSVSNWSFTTHSNHQSRPGSARAMNPAAASHPSIPQSINAKSAFWFGPATPGSVPPVPALPSPYRPSSPTSTILGTDPDPFRREAPTPPPRNRSESGSQGSGSWLTSESGTKRTVVSQWSYPTTRPEASCHDLNAGLLNQERSRPVTPAIADAQVLGGYSSGFAPGSNEVEKGLASFAVDGNDVDISGYRVIGWLLMVWIPFGLGLPYFFMVNSSGPISSMAITILLSLSVTISSPLLALNVIFCPLPIPTGLFDIRSGPSSATLVRSASPHDTVSRYKRSGSITVVEGKRSTDLWMSQGDAVGGKTKFGRAVGMLAPAPKLSILPPKEVVDDEGVALTPPLPMQFDDGTGSFGVPTPQSKNSAELGRMQSAASSHYSTAEDRESLAYNHRIMIAQKHYSAVAQTFMVAGTSPEKVTDASATGADVKRHSNGHLRARSITSLNRSNSNGAPSPPPSFPLPPTPPTLKNARMRAKMGHRKAMSSGAFSLSALDENMNEIDALTAGLLPMLVPGLKVGKEMKVRDDISPAGTFSKASKKKLSREFGGFGGVDGEFSPPDMQSTPAQRRDARARKISGHKKNHYSLPSLGLGREGIHSLALWKSELNRALESHAGKYATVSAADLVRRATVWGAESTPNKASQLGAVREEDEKVSGPSKVMLGRSQSTRSLGLRADVPVSVSSTSARESVATLLSNAVPPSAASTVTLFDFEGGLGPQAESTPPDNLKRTNQPISKRAAPRNPLPTSTSHTRRSSIVYIKSDENDAPTNPITSSRSFSRAVRQLVPKKSILQRKQSSSNDIKPGTPGRGLRPLSLLQDRDTNRQETTSPGGTRPLTLGKKKQQQLMTIPDDDENNDPRSMNRKLKQLQLARSETSKQRGVLRASEVLPDVVVRPPSTGEHLGFVYGYAH